jgi:hypothetical protein
MQDNPQIAMLNARKEEILDDLSRLTEWEIKSFALTEKDIPVVNEVLEYKRRKEMKMKEQEALSKNEPTVKAKIKALY